MTTPGVQLFADSFHLVILGVSHLLGLARQATQGARDALIAAAERPRRVARHLTLVARPEVDDTFV
jgi:hypothetical protein